MKAAVIVPHDYTALIGHRLTVSYTDQNEAFAPYLPRSGTVIRQVALENWGDDWLVLQLAEPFEYQLGLFGKSFRKVAIDHFLIRSRWADCPIGKSQTSAFLLLDPKRVVATKNRFHSTDFIMICWALIQA